jgi:hypothetical protein
MDAQGNNIRLPIKILEDKYKKLSQDPGKQEQARALRQKIEIMKAKTLERKQKQARQRAQVQEKRRAQEMAKMNDQDQSSKSAQVQEKKYIDEFEKKLQTMKLNYNLKLKHLDAFKQAVQMRRIKSINTQEYNKLIADLEDLHTKIAPAQRQLKEAKKNARTVIMERRLNQLALQKDRAAHAQIRGQIRGKSEAQIKQMIQRFLRKPRDQFRDAMNFETDYRSLPIDRRSEIDGAIIR